MISRCKPAAHAARLAKIRGDAMNPLSRRLAVLRLKVRFLDGWQGICALLTLILTVGVGVGLLDFWVYLPTLVRAAVLVGLLIGAAGIVYRFLVRPFGKPCNDLNLALRVEEEFPELNDSLASTVQFLSLSKEERDRLGASESMRARTVQDTIERAAKYDFASILNRRAALLFGLAAVCALGVTGWLSAYYGPYARTAFWRLAEPFGMHTWTQVEVYREAIDDKGEKIEKQLDPRGQEEDRIAIGRPYIINVFLKGQIPKQARVEILGKIRSDMTIAKLTPGENGRSASFVAPINMTQQYQDFKFRVVANDGAFPPRAGAWHEVKVMHKPKLIDLDHQPSPQITVFPPGYTDLPSPAKLLAGAKHLEVYAGSRAVYRAKADRPLTQALIRWQTEDPTQLQLAQMGAGVAVWDKAVATFDDNDKSVFSIELHPWASGSYVLYMRDAYGLESEEVADIRVVKDPIPVVTLLRPASSAEFAPDAVVPFKFLVSDEKFAVRSVYVEYRRRALDGKELDDEPTRTVLYESQLQGKLIPWQLAQALGAAGLVPDLRLRQTKLNFDVAWALKNQKFKEGQIIVLEVCADDYCDIYPTRPPGKSQLIELRIVSKREIVRRAEEKLNQIQQDLEKAAKLEQQALDTVREIRKENKIDQAVKDKLIDGADGPQKDVRDLIGKTPDEGIRSDLKKLRDTLKANNLDNTKVFKDAREFQGALDNIAQEELQQIEPMLNDIRSDFNQSDKNDPKTKAKLDMTARLQKNVADTLNELIAKMDPGAKMRNIHADLSSIVGQQQQLREDMAKLKADKAQDENNFPDKKAELDKVFKDRLAQKAEEQKNLAERLEKLVSEMKAEQQQQEKLGNKKEAEQIKDAIQQIQQKPRPKEDEPKLPLNSQMKKVADQLKDKSEAPQQALDQQQKIADDLEKALKAMEGRNPDLAQQDIKDRKVLAKEIDKHNRDLQKLRDDTKKADQIKDEQERLKKKEEIAQQFDNLENDIEKTRRQAARLQEQQAANELKQAADEVAKAGQKARQGDNADAEQQKAKDHLREAKIDVKESEEELAREMLVKMADQLKGLKERQDASLKRSEALHPKVMKKKSWTDPLLDTMEGNIGAQKGIAEETDGLQEKLKGVVVFGGILERAKKFMDGAGTVMENRHTEGKDRRYEADGKQMDDMELKDEVEWQDDTLKNQKQAARSLTNLLDALKEEIDKPRKNPREGQKPKDPDNNNQPEEPKGGVPNQDGIPPKAQLKALKAEQLDLNEKTADFAKRNPDPTQYNDRQRAELRQLEREQEQLQDFFHKLTAPPQKEGEQP
jgi:hypothetical protein